MLNWLIPRASTVIRHPIYHFEIQTKRRRRTLQMIFTTTRKWFFIIFAIMIALWAFSLWNASRNNFGYVTYAIYDASQDAIGWYFFIGLAASLLIDIVSVLVSVGSINRQLVTGHWDLLRLTTLDDRDIIHTKHTITQVQAWRMFTVVLSIRLTTLLLFIFQSVFIPYSSYSNETLLKEFLDEAPRHPFMAVSVVILAALLTLCYLLEPFWRLRAVTALGMWVSARVRRISSALLAGFGLIPFIWISQGFVLYILYQIIYHTGNSISRYRYSDEEIMLFFLFWTTSFVLIVYAYYALLKRVGLARATKDAFKPV